MHCVYVVGMAQSLFVLGHEAIDFVEQAPEHGRDERGVGDEAADDGQRVLTNVPHLKSIEVAI